MNTPNILLNESVENLTSSSCHASETPNYQRHFMIIEKAPELWMKLQPQIVGRGDHITASNTVIGIEDILSCQAVDAVLIRLEGEADLLSASLNLRENYPYLPIIHIGDESLSSDTLNTPQHYEQININLPLTDLITHIDRIVGESRHRLSLLNKQLIWHYCSASNRLIDAKHNSIQLTANEGRFIAVIMQFSAQQVISRHAFAVGLNKEHAKGLDKLLNVIASRLRNKVAQHSNQPFELTLIRGSGIKFVGEIHRLPQLDC
ncbi:MAG TPA: hypothetical protein PLU46_10385 [Thiotrichales bacterium]|nr:hypothetical protein [Gammaproteobacteria bacterium]OYZ03775.1 MAG: hypothetical protein B7Y29_07820 [Thiotrichales bacterium 16-46-22]UCG19293.1 MAG: hypothetical protein JSU84_03550 [Thiotrichales bacterium]HQT02369.1 hypothetical protein [Thiotrichales bacterium]HQT05383.1 hypothetical protein [Thiotrichales bacterium]